MTGANAIILPESEESAQFVTLTGWKSRDGLFFGNGPDSERLARAAGATHKRCACGSIFEARGYTICDECREKKAVEKYKARPTAEWNGTDPIYSEAADQWFSDADAVIDYCHYNDTTPDALRLLIGKPAMAKEVDPHEHYCDDLPEDGNVPAEIADAFEVLNAAILTCTTPLCWWPGDFAVAPGSITVKGEE